MLLMPVGEILCKVVSHSTCETVTFFMLVVVHGLCHSQTQALDDIWLRHSRVQRFGIRQKQLFLSECCHPTCRGGVPPVLLLICIKRPLLPV